MVYDELMKMMEMLLMMVMLCVMACLRIRIVAAMTKSTYAMPLKLVRDFPLPVLMPNVIPGSLRMGQELDSHQRAEVVVVYHPSLLKPSMFDLLLEYLKASRGKNKDDNICLQFIVPSLPGFMETFISKNF